MFLAEVWCILTLKERERGWKNESRVFAAFPGPAGSVPSIHNRQPTTTYNSSSRGADTLWLLWVLWCT